MHRKSYLLVNVTRWRSDPHIHFVLFIQSPGVFSRMFNSKTTISQAIQPPKCFTLKVVGLCFEKVVIGLTEGT